MKKFIGMVTAAFMLTAGFASAASITNIQFDNGQTATPCTAGQSVHAKIRISVPAGEVAEVGQTDTLGDNLAPALPFDLNPGNDLGIQAGFPKDVDVTFVCPQNTGYYTPEFRTAGIFGGDRASSMTDGVVTVQTFSNALHVTADGTNTTSGSSPASDKLQDILNALSILMAKFMAGSGTSTVPTTPTTPTVSSVCAAFAQANAGTQINVYNDSNATLQGFLVGQGALKAGYLAALKQGASFGFYGNQTTSAVGWFNSLNHCN